jgi:sporulation protein YlmC with PRC-barrel domain
MRLSDLLGSEVITTAERGIGRVHEVRAVQDGPLQGAFGAALRIDGLIVGRGSIGTRLGLDRKDVKSPAAIRIMLDRLLGPRLYVPWNRVVAVENHRVIVVDAVGDFRSPEALSSTEQINLGGSA